MKTKDQKNTDSKSTFERKSTSEKKSTVEPEVHEKHDDLKKSEKSILFLTILAHVLCV